jgi:hypothetical protein
MMIFEEGKIDLMKFLREYIFFAIHHDYIEWTEGGHD